MWFLMIKLKQLHNEIKLINPKAKIPLKEVKLRLIQEFTYPGFNEEELINDINQVNEPYDLITTLCNHGFDDDEAIKILLKLLIE